MPFQFNRFPISWKQNWPNVVHISVYNKFKGYSRTKPVVFQNQTNVAKVYQIKTMILQIHRQNLNKQQKETETRWKKHQIQYLTTIIPRVNISPILEQQRNNLTKPTKWKTKIKQINQKMVSLTNTHFKKRKEKCKKPHCGLWQQQNEEGNSSHQKSSI